MQLYSHRIGKVLRPTKQVILALFLLLQVDVSAAHAADAAHPNIILILADDMGYGDTEPFGSTLNKTPNLNQMAQEGMKLTSFYGAPVCSASRAQIITGCYAPRVSIPGVLGTASPTGLSSSEHTVAELLKAQGYATMIIGKWHLGDQLPFLPLQHGFDRYLGLPYSNDMLETSTVEGRPVVPLVQDNTVIQLIADPGEDALTELYADTAVKYIQDNRDHPFFLYLAHCAVHVPLHPGKDFQGKSANGKFGDWVQELDYTVGRVLDAVKSAKLDSNTLVIFTSDNGPWLAKGNQAGTAGPLRGGKFSTWEGGVREPFLAWWPGHIQAGTVSDTVAANIDFLPTFVSLAGGTVPSQPKIDGIDISPLLLGKAKELPDDAFCYFSFNGGRHYLDAVREGPWKLSLRPQKEFAHADERTFPPDAATPGPRLYNLNSDIGEKTDVAGQHPDIVAQLTSRYDAMAAQLGSGVAGPEVRPPGRVDHPQMLYPAIKKQPPGKIPLVANHDPTTTYDEIVPPTPESVASANDPGSKLSSALPKASFRAAEIAVEQRVDAGALQVRGTIERVVSNVADQPRTYLLRIDSSNEKSENGREIIVVPSGDNHATGDPWPAADKKATIYHLGTTRYTTPQNQPTSLPLYVASRDEAIIWTLSQ